MQALLAEKTLMTYAIIGSRICTSPKRVFPVLRRLLQNGDMIISGGAKGADKLAEQFAQQFNFTIQVFPANRVVHGKSAGPIRNQKIIDECDEVICFWDGVSKGTKNALGLARKARKPIHLFWI
jgi:hypothetical protein